ncbi:MAG TPA: hypothetical protein VJB89_02085 [Candidatus Nanoarchaeia archaeon]|nr:hypothetical protein [Candidatus Nanoarchaeia archaeon]
MFQKKELCAYVYSLLVLTFVFGFDDGSEIFVLENWLMNLLKVFFMVLIVFFLKESGHKIMARWRDCIVEYRVWTISSLWFSASSKLKKPFRLGIWLPLLISFLTQGGLALTFTGEHVSKGIRTKRVGRIWTHVTDYERSLICVGGYMMLAVFLIVLNVLNKFFGFDVDLFVRITFFMVIFNYIPFHRLDGSYIFFGGKLIYVISLIFVVLSYLLFSVGLGWGVFISLVIALLIAGILFYRWNQV